MECGARIRPQIYSIQESKPLILKTNRFCFDENEPTLRYCAGMKRRAAFLYSVGVRPVTFLKATEKAARLRKPTS